MSSKIFIGFFVCFVLALLLYLFQSFLLNILIAALLAVATSNINVKILQITNGKKTLSAGLTTIVLLFLFVAPSLYAIASIVKYATNFNADTINSTIEYIKNYHFSLPVSFSFLEPSVDEFLGSLDFNKIITNAISSITGIGKLSAKFLTDMIFVLVFFFFAMLYGGELVKYLKDALPMQKEDSEFILSEVANVMSVVFYSIIINMILQGFLFSLVTMYYGYDGILTGILFAFTSLIPVVGGMLSWVPISLHQFASGDSFGAVVIAVYSVIVISIVADTFLKPLVIKFINSRLVKKPAKINELLIFFAMIAGITTFGFWGIILGPAIVTLFISTIRLYVLLRDRI
ncbi:acid membrane antigen A [Campylobacter mucosalis]|uniref:AI-2E family transporter n=1 Tax=Campylobacter mucosalis TaxID=202 RepID=UPI000B263B1E|nr:AI-2E family transporter [Campylobacter mucosalis]QKF63840.1 acid membrane antigen A [Campylobacter mucosalis]